MNNRYRYSIIITLLQIAFFSASAQIKLDRSFDVSMDSVKLILKVDNFADIAAFQFGVDFDSTVLTFERYAFDPFFVKDESSNLLRNNHIRHVWSSGKQANLENGTVFYTLVFSIKDNSATQSVIDISATEFPSEFASGVTGLAVEHQWTGDTSVFLGTNAVGPQWLLPDSEVRVLGNPVQDNIRLQLENLAGHNGQIKIFSSNSGIIYHDEFVILTNQTLKNISTVGMQPGLYYAQVNIDKKHSKTIRLLLQH